MALLEITFYVLLFLVAFLYASVGHGGASGYLALMTLFSVAPETMRGSALVLNLFVSALAFFQYYRAGHFNFKLFYPFVITSVPAAFLGGLFTISGYWYKKILALMLLLSALRFVVNQKEEIKKTTQQLVILSLFIGAIIGLISGMIGIGGGIILSPLLLLLHWASVKETAAVSSLFIFVNSLAGLAGLLVGGFELTTTFIPLLTVSIAGGMAGAYVGARRLNNRVLQLFLAFVLIIASIKLVIT